MSAQSAKYNPLISKLYLSRKIILELLKDHRNYDIDNYKDVGIHELQEMLKNKQMDMLLTKTELTSQEQVDANMKSEEELELEANYRTTLKNKLQGEVNDEIKLNGVLDGINEALESTRLSIIALPEGSKKRRKLERDRINILNTHKEAQINLDAAFKVSDTTEKELASMLAKKNMYVDKMTKVNIPEEQNRIKRELEYARMAMHAEPKDSDKRHQLELDYYNKLFSPDKINKNDFSPEMYETGKKIYIKYHLEGKLKQTHIYEYIDDIFDVEQILSNNDELLIITKDKMNQITKDLLVNIYNNDKKVVNIYNLNDFLFNIMKHDMVPPHRILSDDEKKEIYTKYYITDDKQLPEISRFDPVALAIGLCSGDLVEIIRSSPTAITTKYYRLCL